MDNSQESTPYLDALCAHASKAPHRFNVPGHQGGRFASPKLIEAFGERALYMDIPPIIRGIDVGQDPTPFEQAQRLAAGAWGARRTWFLANGASQGNHAIHLALRQLGQKLVLQRNAHSSMFDSLVLTGMEPTFAYPEIDEQLGIAHCVTAEELDRAIRATPDAVAAIVVSPTYFGFTADIEELAAIAHGHGLPLIVDEAWGAHFAFSPNLPQCAIDAGADIVTSSTHKMLGSITQSAMLHTGPGGRIDDTLVDRAVSLVESTSPNALLEGSLDAARQHAAVAGQPLIDLTIEQLAQVRDQLASIPGVQPLDRGQIGRFGIVDYDPFRITLDVTATGHSGNNLNISLNDDANVYIELIQARALVAIAGIGEHAEDFKPLVDGLRDAAAGPGDRDPGSREESLPASGEMMMTPREAFFAASETVATDAAIGRVAAEAIAVYPPGVPNILHGEVVTAANVDYIRGSHDRGYAIRGAADRSLQTVRVVARQ